MVPHGRTRDAMTNPREHTSVQYRRKAVPLSLVRRIIGPQQRRLYEAFARAFPPRKEWSVLDLGVNASLERSEQYFFEHHYPYRSRITACGLEAPDRFHRCYPDVRYVRAERDGPLPFMDGEFDVVFCNAVVEHVGGPPAQRAFVREIARISRAAFITTPNRWYPIELHTVLPLVHWLPTPWYRAVFRRLGFHFFASEDNLNLLDRSSLRRLVPDGVRAEVHGHRFLGLPSNLLLVMGGG